MSEFDKNVVTSKSLDELTDLIGHTNKELTMKYRREHKYNLTETQESLYKDIVFETSKINMRENTRKPVNQLRKQNTQKIRNWDKLNSSGIEKAQLPKHIKVETTVKNKFEEYIDPYKYLENPTDAQLKAYESREELYRLMLTTKHQTIEEVFRREIENK